MKKIIHTSEAPEAIGPYSQAVVHNDIVYCSGQIGLDPETMEFVGDDVASQAEQVMKNLEAVLLEAGSGFGKVIKCGIYLDDMSNFETVNEIYGSYFKSDPPARETVAVKTLPKNCKVEIGCTAYI
ncbi:RidA family protein [Fodinibius saliphilus]|uniref:RidA family protein n=1 Tax=Fodinibius saliphilus TaxID=1920650 RepID=UPI001108F1D3|nr:RidA family protein [Fodinibius saliphilus]